MCSALGSYWINSPHDPWPLVPPPTPVHLPSEAPMIPPTGPVSSSELRRSQAGTSGKLWGRKWFWFQMFSSYRAGINRRTVSFLEFPVGGSRDQTTKTLSGGTKFQSQGRSISNLDARPFEKLLEPQTPYSETVPHTHTHITFHTPLGASQGL